MLLLTATAVAEAPDAFQKGMAALLEGNFAEAWCHWKPLAEQGHAESQYNLGWLYANGNGLAVDMGRAFYWWKQAAAQGHADAEFAIGLAYTTGEGVERDLAEAVRWIYRAAGQGHPDARDILLRLAGDPEIDVLAIVPELLDQSWFGWTGQVTGKRINVRASPGTGARIVTQLEQHQQVRVLGRRGNWLRIQLPAREGEKAPRLAWVYHSLLKPVRFSNPCASRETGRNHEYLSSAVDRSVAHLRLALPAGGPAAGAGGRRNSRPDHARRVRRNGNDGGRRTDRCSHRTRHRRTGPANGGKHHRAVAGRNGTRCRICRYVTSRRPAAVASGPDAADHRDLGAGAASGAVMIRHSYQACQANRPDTSYTTWAVDAQFSKN
ncbi:SH3 domain-containing protein [endosymbiont of unidentified scaly snail isolate Monju]|uniref:SH3 domain-containing protein n=1 Tax=endosymbiont of unidentified scaly snail isolate Monju TaxID=1248727 RepID=UPI0014941CE7|nr:SH3 domain-containing protein [endosymbiont of unidentified scaly snail isolate Monju]